MRLIYFITHPDVVINPDIPVPHWPLSQRGKERMQKLLNQPWIANIGAVYSSAEQKALDAATILAEHLALAPKMIGDLGEIDRSATGYLPHEEHEATADEFFSHPDQSIRGWEMARQAQQRIAQAVETLIENDSSTGNMAIVSHGGVGTLYLCYLKSEPISRLHEQPGSKGGNYYCFAAQTKTLVHGWKPIDD